MNSNSNPKNPKDSQSDDEDYISDDRVVEVIDKTNGTNNNDGDIIEDLNEMDLENENDMDDDIDADDEDDDQEQFVINMNDNSKQTITHHTGAVFCVDTFKNFIASGGEDDKAYIWSINTSSDGEISAFDLYMECEKFGDSVTNVKFSCDGKYVAVADMLGDMRVYLLDTKELFWSFNLENDIEVLKWHPNCNVLFCSTSDGNFYMFKISTNEIKLMYAGDQTSLTCFNILKDGKRAACFYDNGTIRFWDLKTSAQIQSFTNCHQREQIICSDMSPDGNLIASGGIDKKVSIRNAQTGKLVCDLALPKSLKTNNSETKIKNETNSNDEMDEDGEEEISIESIAFAEKMPFVACATLEGDIIVWDHQTQHIRSHINAGAGVSKILFKDEKLLASTLDGKVIIYDSRNLELKYQFEGHSSEVLDFCLNEQLGLLVTSSNDNTIKLFQTNEVN